jgi:hypothetical protein
MSFEEQLSQWIQLDCQLKLLNEKTNHLRETKQNLTQKIMNYVEENKLSTIQLGNNKIKFTKNNIPQPITFKYLENSLRDIIKNEHQVKQIIDYIKQKREIKTNFEIKQV